MGPMFSGKSSELQRRLRRYAIAKRKCVLVKARPLKPSPRRALAAPR